MGKKIKLKYWGKNNSWEKILNSISQLRPVFPYLVKFCLSIWDFKTNPDIGKIFVFRRYFICSQIESKWERAAGSRGAATARKWGGCEMARAQILKAQLSWRDASINHIILTTFMHSNDYLPFTWMWLLRSFLWIINDNIKEVPNGVTWLPCQAVVNKSAYIMISLG